MRSRTVGSTLPSLEAIREKDPAQIAVLERNVASLGPAKLEADCKTCDDARFVLSGPIHQERVSDLRMDGRYQPVRDVVPCPDCNAPKPADLIVMSGIPAQYCTATFETFKPVEGKSDALNRMRAWSENPVESVMLRGASGRGKTHLLCAALLTLIQRGTPVKFVQARKLIEEIQAGFKNETSGAVEERYRRAPVLGLDDIGAARPTEYARDRIQALVEERLLDGRPTVITSDKNSAELMGFGYDERLISRLTTYDLIRIEGDDMRGAK